eukprot:scaffold8312_cov63-Phaeocystis_antarctica.AAC.2
MAAMKCLVKAGGNLGVTRDEVVERLAHKRERDGVAALLRSAICTYRTFSSEAVAQHSSASRRTPVNKYSRTSAKLVAAP